MENMEPVIREVAPGIIVAMAEDQMCGTWVLYHGVSCFIVEMPPKAIDFAPKLKTYFDTVFSDDVYETNIEGEPLYLIHAPKHSSSDVMIVFRGTMITGDWWLGWGDPNWNKVPPVTSIKSIDRILDFLKNHKYVVTRLFSAHANDFRYGVNAESVLLETRRYHEMKLEQEQKKEECLGKG